MRILMALIIVALVCMCFDYSSRQEYDHSAKCIHGTAASIDHLVVCVYDYQAR